MQTKDKLLALLFQRTRLQTKGSAFMVPGSCISRSYKETKLKAEITEDVGNNLKVSVLKALGRQRSIICE